MDGNHFTCESGLKVKDFRSRLRSYRIDSKESGTKLRAIQKHRDSALARAHDDDESSYKSMESSDWSDMPAPSRTKKKKKSARSRAKSQRATKATVSNEQACEPLNGSSDSNDWEEVDEVNIDEKEYLNRLLTQPKIDESESQQKSKNISVILGKSISGTKRSSDPTLQAIEAATRVLKEHYSLLHWVHVCGNMTYARFVNHACDHSIIRALGLSLLSDCSLFAGDDASFSNINLWTIKHIEACLFSFKKYTSLAPDLVPLNASSTRRSIVERLANKTCTQYDPLILLVAALRSLGFDVRLLVSFSPLHLRPSNRKVQQLANLIKKSLKLPAEDKQDVKKAHETKVISSESETDSEIALNKPCLDLFIEVFLPSDNRWICPTLNPHVDAKDKPDLNNRLYVIGLSSTKPICIPGKDVIILPQYVGRSPIDLASRYDENWCVLSRRIRMPNDQWTKIIEFFRRKFNLDAAGNHAIVEPTKDNVLLMRDLQDAQEIRVKLLSQPFPKRVQDYKNHPLYALKRHLLKFEIIFPPDVNPLGYVGKEAIYSRDCLYLCHTRESWLKEARIIRLGEKPAKVVRARLSMKRKLLQDSDEPPTVDVYGQWQTEPYVPPVALNGKVPRNEYGNVELFKPCMLPIGCVHIRLSGIQPIAKKLGIDIVQAMVGWTFHGAGWVHPNFDGFVVCREDIPILMDAWRQARRDQLKAAAEERTQRSISNWQRLVRGLQLWQRVQAQFELVRSAVSTCKPLGAGQKVPREAKHSTESGRGRRGGKGRVRGSGKSQEASSFIIAAQDQIGKPEAGDLTYFGDSRLHDELTTHGCSKEIEKLEDSEPEAQLDAEEQLHESVQADRKQASGAPPDPITSVLPASSFTQLASHKWRCLDSLMPFGNPADLPTLFPAGQRCSYRQSRARGSCARRGGFSGPCVKRRIRKKRSGSTDSSESVSSTADKENSISSHESDGEWQRPKALPAALTKQDLPRRSSRRCPDRKSAFQKA